MSIRDFLFRYIVGHLYYLPILRHSFWARRRVFRPMYQRLAATCPCKVPSTEKTVVYMVKEETTFSGGLSDRLRGITAIYQMCKQLGLRFKINFENPPLQDYLQPQDYDWCLRPEEIDYDMRHSYPCTILTYHPYDDQKERYAQEHILKMFLRKRYQQIHIYSNMKIADEAFGPIFHELFRPTDELQQVIDSHLTKIGGKGSYVSCTFRFRQLLGDFKEGGDTLPVEQRKAYIERCVRTVEHLYQSCRTTILVTSDSGTFLSRVSSLPYVYVVPGKVVHIGFTFDASKQVYMKSFVDYYMLSYAKTVYVVLDKLMYHSGFPLRAALLNRAEYKEINLL